MKRQDHHGKYIKLRQQYPYFRFVDYAFKVNNNELDIKFTFDIAGKFMFRPSLKVIHRDFYEFSSLSHDELSNMVFHIGMIELLSYWKLTCSPELIIESNSLSKEQITWWKKLYYHGLGEFFYLNGITPDQENFVEIITNGDLLKVLQKPLSDEKVIIPIGGGKDSIVTLELLKDSGFELFPMMLNPREASVRTIELAGYHTDQSIVVERKLDTLMLELNSKGFLNGHTPFSALLAFVNVLTAVASGSKYVALSNENSANESTVPGSNINHQYSKSFEFELDFANYSKKYLHPEIEYFSFLRPLNELQIAQLFASFPAHFPSFRSCNVGSKEDSWCGKCPKCLFTYIILSPFVTQDEVIKIFDKNLLDDMKLKPIFEELTGISVIKPFECVGTSNEVNAALKTAYTEDSIEKTPELLKMININDEIDTKELLSDINIEHLLPASFFKILLNKLSLPLVDQFQFFVRSKFGMHSKIMILGFGKEGQSTYKLVRICYPEAILHIADKNQEIKDLDIIRGDNNLVFYLGEDYQSELAHFSIIFKSPGVKVNQSLVSSNQIYSQADIFLEYFRDQTIGITGTKGKSTTASLIHHLLIKSGRDVILLGNMGIPPFEMLNKIHNNTVIVYEMSAHQLEYVHHSPHIGVLLNIFPEHLDHFDSFEDYSEAKYHIFQFQKPEDFAITQNLYTGNIRSNELIFGRGSQKGLDAFYESDELVFTTSNQNFTIESSQLLLLGDHNKLNILAAMLAVFSVGIEFRTSFSNLSSFNPLPHRLEYVGRFQYIDFYNDSISTVPESTIAAVETLKDINTIILGGFDRGLDYGELITLLNKSKIKHFLLLGKAGDAMFQLFEKTNSEKDYRKVNNIREAVIYAMQQQSSGKCLLSPAAASYDQFHNFEHRGDTYKEMIRNYGQKKSG